MQMIVEGLGFKELIIRGITSKRFVIYFPNEELLSSQDLDFLAIGFESIRKASWEDL